MNANVFFASYFCVVFIVQATNGSVGLAAANEPAPGSFYPNNYSH